MNGWKELTLSQLACLPTHKLCEVYKLCCKVAMKEKHEVIKLILKNRGYIQT